MKKFIAIANIRPWFSKKQFIAGLLIVILFAPLEARAIGLGDIVSLITTITGTLQNVVGGALNDIQGIQTAIDHYREETIWPLNDLNQIRAFVSATRSQYSGLMAQIQSIRNNSANLANPRQLESALRGGGINGTNQFSQLYTQVYATVPDPTSARPVQRDMMDIDDALAMDALKTTVVSDQSTAQLLTLADSIEQESIKAAPGSAPLLGAQARITDLVAQAQMEKMLAAELRQEAAKLAHQNGLLKQSAAATRNLQKQMQQVLSHP